MIKGKWVIIAVLVVAVGMGVATWPLLKMRRKREIWTTQSVIANLRASCENHQKRHGRYPENLEAFAPDPLSCLDAWRRPIRYEAIHTEGRVRARLWSLGPSEADSADDISVELP